MTHDLKRLMMLVAFLITMMSMIGCVDGEASGRRLPYTPWWVEGELD